MVLESFKVDTLDIFTKNW